jgi:hypothetical protein
MMSATTIVAAPTPASVAMYTETADAIRFTPSTTRGAELVEEHPR